MDNTPGQDVSVLKGRLIEQQDDHIVLGLPGTDYQLRLVSDQPASVEVGHTLVGRVYADAMRVDIASSGGRYIEPVFGRPRRVQGRIIARDAKAGSITVLAACPMICRLTADQKPEDLPIGRIGTFDVKQGARFVEIQS